MKEQPRGAVLIGVLAVMITLLILLPALVSWVGNESRWTVKEQKNTTAFNLAEAAVDRGMWKLKSSTGTWSTAIKGAALTNYAFDKNYDDVDGGYYRIRFSSGPGTKEVTIYGEGKDLASKQTRAIKAVYRNQAIPGAVMSGGVITWANALSAHWGPVMSHNNINITDANAAQDYFPRKFSKQVVTANSKGYERDTNGLTPPNTDNTEWWSDYAVPDLPQLDFAALKSSAQAMGTYNIYGCSKRAPSTANDASNKVAAPGAWWGKNACAGPGSPHTYHFQNSWNFPNARSGYVFYWDQDNVHWTGQTGAAGNGIWGTVIVANQKNLTIWSGDNYGYNGPVPSSAWEEYAKISKTGGDSSSSNQYPADDGYQKNRTTFNFGSETWTDGSSPPPAANTDVGLRGLMYVTGNLKFEGPMDVNGAVWVQGGVDKATGSERCVVFFDDTLDVPTLNVVLVRQSWMEVSPSTATW